MDSFLNNKEVLESETLKTVYGISEDELDKAHAMQALMHSTRFWEDSFVFEKIVRALNNLEVTFVNLQGVRPEHIWKALKITQNMWPGKEFSWEVQKYTQWISNEDGVFIYPPEMDELDNRFYEEAQKLIDNKVELKDSNVYEVQASKLLLIDYYINNKPKSK